jgi:light-regulated signal transduction histidine kinase (bacteriophytochrome)
LSQCAAVCGWFEGFNRLFFGRSQIAFSVFSALLMNSSVLNFRETEASAVQEVDLRVVLLRLLREFRITLRHHGIEVLYSTLPWVQADEERVERFFRTAIGRIVHFSQGSKPVVLITTQAREAGLDLVVTATREGSEHLLVVGYFTEANWPQRA